jgi:hypothetical protein
MILTGDGHQAMVDRPLALLGEKRRVAIEDSILHTGGVRDCADRFSSHGASHLGQDHRAHGRFTDD